jgi:hypothetical protein
VPSVISKIPPFGRQNPDAAKVIPHSRHFLSTIHFIIILSQIPISPTWSLTLNSVFYISLLIAFDLVTSVLSREQITNFKLIAPPGSGYFSSQTFHVLYTTFSTAVTLHTYSPMKMEQTEYSETLAFKLQTSGNNPKENIRYFYLVQYYFGISKIAVIVQWMKLRSNEY